MQLRTQRPALALLLVLAPAAAEASPRVGVMGLRLAQPGALSAATVQSANSLLWQGVSSVAGIVPVAEPQVAASLGAAGRTSLSSCATDACMAQVGHAAQLDRVVYAVASPGGSGFTIFVRSIQVQPFAVLAQQAPTCASCGEAEVLSMLAGTDLGLVAAEGGTSSGAAAAPPPGGGGAGKLELRSKPSGARVSLGSRVLGTTPLKVELPAGAHVFTLDYHGYRSAAVPVTLEVGKRLRETVELDRVLSGQGTLTLTSEPSAAQVVVAGRPVGVTPLRGVAMQAGDYTLTLQAPGYRPSEVRLRVLPAEETKKAVKLEALPSTAGVLAVETEPPGADVFVEGRPLGKGPLSVPNVAPGEYVLTARAPGFSDAREMATVKAGKVTRVRLALEAPGGLTVVVTSGGDPMIAHVRIDGKDAGESPVTVGRLAPGEHEVTAVGPGLRPVARKVRVKAGEVEIVRFELEASLGLLTLRSDPSGADVLDGEVVVGKTPLRRKPLPVGARILVVRAEGHEPRPLPVNLVDGKEEEHKVSLTPLPATLLVVTTAGGRPFAGMPVKVDGKPAGVSPLTVTLPHGAHEVEASGKGVVPVRRKLKLKPGAREELSLAMKVPQGKVELTSKPPGAEVLIGSAPLGKTPLKGMALPSGTLELTLRLAGYVELPVKVDVVQNKTTRKAVELTPLPPVLVVESVPPGAAVAVDGEEVGTTPLRTDGLKPGGHEVRLTLEGYRDVRRKVELRQAEERKLAETLEARQGLLRITTAPAGATVLVDGRELGTTPLDGAPVLVGEHSVELRLDRYQPATRKVVVAEGASVALAVTLATSPGSLEVATTPGGASVLLDGKAMGTTPLSLAAVAVGSHTLRLERAGHDPVERQLEVEPGGEVRLDVPLALSAAAQARLDYTKAHMTRRIAMVASYGVATATAAAAGVFLWLDASKRADLDSSVSAYNDYLRSDVVLDPAERDRLAGAVSDADLAVRQRDDRMLGLVSLGVAAAAVGAGTWLLLSEPPPPAEEAPPDAPDEPGAEATLLPLPDGLGVGLSGRW